MTVGRYTGQTKAGISNHNLQYQKDVCMCHFWCWKKGDSEPLSLIFQDNDVWKNPSWERSTDRCTFLNMYNFRNILRIDLSVSLMLIMWVWWIFSTDECDSTTEHTHLRRHFSWAERQPQGTMTSVLKPSQRNSYRHSHWHKYSYGNSRSVSVHGGYRDTAKRVHTHARAQK